MTSTYYTGEERSKRIFAIVGASSGNLVEWFDFYVYAFCAIYFRPGLLPPTTPRCSCSTRPACSPRAS
jgi:MHS family dicarboxylic acid transporter PcaT-like MFS transporter